MALSAALFGMDTSLKECGLKLSFLGGTDEHFETL